MANPVEIPLPPLNAYTAFPFKVDPFPQDWLRQFCVFNPIAASNEDRQAPDPQHFED